MKHLPCEIDTFACPLCDLRITPAHHAALEPTTRCERCMLTVSSYVFVPLNPALLSATTGAIMNCTVVTLPGKCQRYVASTAEGRQMREIFMQEFGVKKKDVKIEPCQILTSKPDLIAFLNEMLATIDAHGQE